MTQRHFVNNAESLTSGTKVKLTVVMDQVKDVLTVPVDAETMIMEGICILL